MSWFLVTCCGNLYFNNGNWKSCILKQQGLYYGMQPNFQVSSRFLFCRLIFSSIRSEASEGRLPRPRGMVDGRFHGFCFLTNLRKTNEFRQN